MAANTIEIRVTATGAEQAQKVLAGIAKEGAQLGSLTSAGAQKAEQALGAMTLNIQKVSGAMGQAGINTGILGQAMGALTSPIGLAATAMAALGLAVHTATESMVRNFEEVRRLQAVSGLSADAADNLADTFQLLGFKSEVLTTALVKMAQEVDSGGKGLAKLGVTIEDLNGQVEGDTFLMLRDRIANLGTAGERSAAGMALFGRGFRELAPLFAMSSAEFEKFQARADKYSKWTEESAELTHRFVTSGNALTLMFDGIAQEIGAALLPGLTKANETLGDWIDAARDVLRVPIAAAWAVIASVAVGLWGALKPIAEVLWQLAKVILPPLAVLLGGALVTALVAVQAALIPVTGTFVFLSEILKGNFTGAVKAAGDAMAAQLTNIDETLAKSKVLGDTLAALASGEVAAVESTDAAREKSNQKNAQLEQLKMQRAAASLQVTQANAAATMALEEAMVKQRVALNQAPETDLIAVQQRALDAKAAALKQSYALELALAQQNNDLTGKAVADVQAKYIASYNQIAVARVDLSTKLLQITQEEERALAGGGIALLQARLASTAALLAIQQKSKEDIVAVWGSEEAVFRAHLGLETQAAIDAAEAQTKTQADFAAAVEAIMAAHYAKLAQFQQQASASGVAAMVASLALAMKDLADLPEVAQLTTDLVALNREIMALKAPTDLDAESITRFGVSFDLLDEATQKVLINLRALKAERAGLAFSKELADIAVQAKVLGPTFDAVGANIRATQQELIRLGKITGEDVSPQIAALTIKLNGLMGEDFVNKLKSGMGLTRTVFDELIDAGRSTASALHTGFSDGFFALFTGQVNSLTDVFKNFGLSMLRVLTDFLASAAVKGLLKFFGSLIEGFGGDFGGGIFGALIGGAAALFSSFSSSSNSTAKTVLKAGDTVASGLNSVTTAASGATTGITLFGQSLSKIVPIVSSIAGAGLSIYGLVQSIQSGSPLGIGVSAVSTALSGYSVLSSISTAVSSTLFPPLSILIAQGFAAVAPATAAAVATALQGIISPALYTALSGGAAALTAVEGGSFAVGAGAFGSGAAAAGGGFGGLIASIASAAGASFLAVFGGMMVSGGFAGQMQDAEDAMIAFKQQTDAVQHALNEAANAMTIFADLGTQLSASHLPATLHTLHDAIRDLGNLDLATGLNQVLGDEGAQGIAAMIPRLRATVGGAWLKALDAAFTQGLDITPGAGDVPNSLQEVLQSPNRISALQQLNVTQPDGTVYMAEFADLFRTFGADMHDVADAMLRHIADLTDPAIVGRDDPAFANARQGIQSVNIPALNALLDKEYLTTTIRNAVVDIGAAFNIGAQQFADRGLGSVMTGDIPTNWRGTPGAGDLPSVAEIAGVQAALEAAGFVPGQYADALVAYLTSIDENIVNNPLWQPFIDALNSAGGDLTKALDAVTLSPAAFKGAASSIIEGLSASIKTESEHLAQMIGSGAAQADIDTVTQQVDAMQAMLIAWTTGFKHLSDTAAGVRDLMPPDLAGAFTETMTPMYRNLVDAMQRGTAEQATQFAQAFQAQLAVWSAFSEAVTAGIDVEAVLPVGLGERFRAAMEPEYAAILESLKTGNATLAQALIEQYNALVKLWETLGQSTLGAQAVQANLPDALAGAFTARMTVSYDKIVTALEAGNATLASKLIDTFNKLVIAWAVIGKTLSTIPVEIGDITGTVEASLIAWQQLEGQLTHTIVATGAAFRAALASGDIERIAATSAAYHDAVIARYQAQVQMAQRAEAAFTAAQTAGATFVQQVLQIAQLEIAGSGSLGTVTALLGVLQDTAEHATSAAQQLWAVDQALKAIIAVLPGAITTFGSMQHAADWLASGSQTAAQLRAIGPNQISRAIVTAAAPFLAVQQTAINNATGGAKLGLLQQQAADWNALANAAIAGVNQWATQAIAGAREAADTVLAGLAKEKDAQLAAIDLRIAGIQRAAQAEQESRRVEMEALSKQIATAREFESAVESMSKFILALKGGTTAPINPRDQLTIAKDAYTAALAAYRAHPTAGGLTNLQQLSTAYLAADEKVYSKPAPHHVALFNLTLEQLEAAKALAAAQASDSELLQSQLEALQALDKIATQSSQDQVDALNAQKKSITDDFETQTKAIEAALKTQVEAIEQAARDEIAGISDGLATALKDNAALQAPLLKAQFDAAQALLDAVGPTAQFQIDTVDLLREISDALNRAIPGGTTPTTTIATPPASPPAGVPTQGATGVERVTEGLFYLHDDEMVIPKSVADRIRSADVGAGLPPGYGTGPGDSVIGMNVDLTGGKRWTGPRASELNAIEAAKALAYVDYAARVAHNQSWGPKHTIHYNYAPAELDQMRADLEARVADWDLQKQTILAEIAAEIAGRVPVIIPPTAPPTAPPVAPPAPPPVYTPAGPGWLNRATGTAEGMPTASSAGAGGGPLTVIVQLDGKTIGKAVLPSVLADARGGAIHEVIVSTKPR